MSNRRFAAIDIGTNTILMVIADVYSDGSFEVVGDYQQIARLGEGFSKDKVIKPNAMERACAALSYFKSECDRLQVDKVSAAGTAAMREARNREQAIGILSAKLGSPIVVITGEDEARLSFCGTIENKIPSIVIDIGGGSTEIIHGQGDLIYYRMSLPVGVVKITERFLSNQPPDENSIEDAKNEINTHFSLIDCTGFEGILYAVAGTPTTLAAVAQNLIEYQPDKIHGYELGIPTINNILQKFLTSSPEQIAVNYNIPPLRADVITAGTLILSEALKHFKLEVCRVSNWGLRYGILKAMINP